MAQIEGRTRPFVVLTGQRGEISVQGEADRVHFLGNVTVPDGYPTRGGAGEPMGSYTIKPNRSHHKELSWEGKFSFQ